MMLDLCTFLFLQPGGAERDIILFMGAPRVANLDEMNSMDLFLSDIPLHDMARDFVMLVSQQSCEFLIHHDVAWQPTGVYMLWLFSDLNSWDATVKPG